MQKRPNSLVKAINVICEAVEFIILSYLLLSCMFSFRTSVVYVLLFAANVVLIQRFWVSLKHFLMSNVAVGVVFIICVIALALLFLKLGYLSMSPIKVLGGVW